MCHPEILEARTLTRSAGVQAARDIRAASDLNRLSKGPGLTAPWNQVQESASALEVGGLSRVSHRRSAPKEDGVEEGADAGAGERGRVRVGALNGEVGGAIEI